MEMRSIASRGAPDVVACRAMDVRAVMRASGKSAMSARRQVSNYHRFAALPRPASYASHPACSMVAAVTA